MEAGSSLSEGSPAGCAARERVVSRGLQARGSATLGQARCVPSHCFSRPQKSYEHLAKIRVAREVPPECSCPPGNRHSLQTFPLAGS